MEHGWRPYDSIFAIFVLKRAWIVYLLQAETAIVIMKKSMSIILTFFVLSGFSQPMPDNKILYVFPDDVEVALDQHIESLPNKEDLQFVLTLCKNVDGTYEIYVNSHSTDDGIVYWERVTNRYAVINDKVYPLLFDYDYDFGAPKPSDIGTYGRREGQVQRIITCNDGFHLTFSRTGICSR